MERSNSDLKSPILGFTRTDLIVAIASLCVLAAAIFVPMKNAQDKARLTLCLENLRAVGGAVLQFAGEHDSTMPGAVRTVAGDSWWWYKEQVKGYAGLSGPSSPADRVFACPMDRGLHTRSDCWL